MTEQLEAFPKTILEGLHQLRSEAIAASEDADKALEKAEQKAQRAHARVYWMNGLVEDTTKAQNAAEGIISYEVKMETGEVLGHDLATHDEPNDEA